MTNRLYGPEFRRSFFESFLKAISAERIRKIRGGAHLVCYVPMAMVAPPDSLQQHSLPPLLVRKTVDAVIQFKQTVDRFIAIVP